MTAEHSPTPWRLGEVLEDTEVRALHSRLQTWEVVARCFNEYNTTEELISERANAEFIVRAVNNFDSLLDACRVALECADTGNPNGWRNRLQEAIRKAEL